MHMVHHYLVKSVPDPVAVAVDVLVVGAGHIRVGIVQVVVVEGATVLKGGGMDRF